MTPAQEATVRKEFQELARIKYQTLHEITFDDLDFNPYILKLMNLQSADEIAEFMISQRVERSLFTTYGHRMQKIARALSATPKGAKAAEIVKEKNGHRHFIQMKSGPHAAKRSGEKGVSVEMTDYTREIKAGDPQARIFLAMSYGKRSRLTEHLMKSGDVEWLVGREFWEFVSDDPDCARKIFEIAWEVAEDYRPAGVTQSYRQLKRPKVIEISQEIQRRYGKDEKEMWRNLFEDNV